MTLTDFQVVLKINTHPINVQTLTSKYRILGENPRNPALPCDLTEYLHIINAMWTNFYTDQR